MKVNIGVFFGGRSVEHEVAVISAVQAMNSINTDKYNIIPVYITKYGEMYTGAAMLDINSFKDIDALLEKSAKVTMVRQKDSFLLIELKKGLFKKVLNTIDIAFPIVHGTNCEDGSIAGWFELLGIPYIGCDVKSAAIGMDKEAFKYVLMQNSVPVLECAAFYAKRWVTHREEIIADIEQKYGYPVVVKPVNLGSSVGISLARDRQELISSINDAMSFAEKLLVEPAISELREFNCSVLGDCDEQECSVIEEPISTGGILSYDKKYKGDGGKQAKGGAKSAGMASLKRKVPADIDDTVKTQLEQYAKSAFCALGCNGVVRIDFLYDCARDKVFVNEINTIPGSLSFYLWEPKGVKYSELIERLVDLSFKRKRTRDNLSFSFDTNILSQGGSFGSKGKK